MVIALALACAGAQVAPGAALLASALALHASDHAHSVSVVADEGHVHLVLSHDRRGHRDRASAGHHDERATATSERNHVFHFTDEDAAKTARRAGVAPALAAVTAVAVMPGPTPLWVLLPSLEPRARSSGSLRTVVLRL